VIKKIFLSVVTLGVLVGLYGVLKPLPSGLQLEGKIYGVPSSSIHFFSDRTYIDLKGVRHSDQQIFDEIFRMIQEADQYILLDTFFFSDFLGTATTSHRQLSRELTDALIEKKGLNPDVIIQVITDPINSMYGGYEPVYFNDLEASGIPVIITNLIPLRDSNPIYSAFWRTFFQWFPDGGMGNILPNLLDANKPKISITAYLNSFNFKANHRKVLMTDYSKNNRTGFSVLVTSANPHDGSSAHSNTAIRVDDYLWRDVLDSERAVVSLSSDTFLAPQEDMLNSVEDNDGDIKVQLLTEGAIEKKVLDLLSELGAGDEFDMAMFYVSDRDIVSALKKADERSVVIRLLLDPNKDAFGREKNGIPNRQVANELTKHTNGNTKIRWCNTSGEQCHSKILIFKSGDNYSVVQGSANLTRRNLNNLNLETNVYISGSKSVKAIDDATQFFNTSWDNESNKQYSTSYDTYVDESLGKTIWYRIGEFTGMSRY
jgi:phosphatidylserine/phosphatidylglycerophosphate/cardiolipin synthase-like enzyme